LVGRAEDEIRIDAEDALGAIGGLEVRRMFSGWGFYQRGLLFAAAWEGQFRFRARQGGHWVYEAVDRELLDRPEELVSAARGILARLEAEPAAVRTSSRRSAAAHRGQQRTL
jgi:TfoX/Sxy family transcriptional regulator of competence genes